MKADRNLAVVGSPEWDIFPSAYLGHYHFGAELWRFSCQVVLTCHNEVSIM